MATSIFIYWESSTLRQSINCVQFLLSINKRRKKFVVPNDVKQPQKKVHTQTQPKLIVYNCAEQFLYYCYLFRFFDVEFSFCSKVSATTKNLFVYIQYIHVDIQRKKTGRFSKHKIPFVAKRRVATVWYVLCMHMYVSHETKGAEQKKIQKYCTAQLFYIFLYFFVQFLRTCCLFCRLTSRHTSNDDNVSEHHHYYIHNDRHTCICALLHELLVCIAFAGFCLTFNMVLLLLCSTVFCVRMSLYALCVLLYCICAAHDFSDELTLSHLPIQHTQ